MHTFTHTPMHTHARAHAHTHSMHTHTHTHAHAHAHAHAQVVCSSLEGDPTRVRQALVSGVALPWAMFMAWEAAVLGASGGGAAGGGAGGGGDPLAALRGSGPLVGGLIDAFSLLAIATSYIGFVLGLTEFIADALQVGGWVCWLGWVGVLAGVGAVGVGDRQVGVWAVGRAAAVRVGAAAVAAAAASQEAPPACPSTRHDAPPPPGPPGPPPPRAPPPPRQTPAHAAAHGVKACAALRAHRAPAPGAGALLPRPLL